MTDVIDTDLLCMGCLEGQTARPCPGCGWDGNAHLPHQLPPGTVLAGRILLGRVLGQGGFGITYLGLDLNLGVKVAVKEYFPHGLAVRLRESETVVPGAGLQCFREEACTLSRLQNLPGVVSVLRYIEDNGTGYLVMKYEEGMTFQAFLSQRGGTIPFDLCLEILTPVLQALHEVHGHGLLHRDISPDNIYLPSQGPALLFDFGAARQATPEHSRGFSVIVKPGFAPEEQYRREGPQGPWTDVYAMAATIYTALTGQRVPQAFERVHADTLQPVSSFGVAIPERAERALMRALAVKASQRIQTVQALAGELSGPVAVARREGPGFLARLALALLTLVSMNLGATTVRHLLNPVPTTPAWTMESSDSANELRQAVDEEVRRRSAAQ